MLKFRIQNVNVVIDRLLNSVLFMLREKTWMKTTKRQKFSLLNIIMQYYFWVICIVAYVSFEIYFPIYIKTSMYRSVQYVELIIELIINENNRNSTMR